MPTFSWKNRDSWPNGLGKECVIDREIDEHFVVDFFHQYTHVTVYHASRPLQPERVTEQGIKIASYESILDEYRANIAKYCGVILETEHLDFAKGEIGRFHDGCVFVVLNDEDLLTYAGHYAIYGSEYLTGITNRISNKFGVIELDCLKKFGTPTVYEIALPINFLTYDDVSCLVRVTNNRIYSGEFGEDIDFTFQLKRNIPGEYIVSYYHPNNIPDPLNQFEKYVHQDS